MAEKHAAQTTLMKEKLSTIPPPAANRLLEIESRPLKHPDQLRHR